MPEANQKDRDDELPIRVLRRYQRANTVQLARRFATEAFGTHSGQQGRQSQAHVLYQSPLQSFRALVVVLQVVSFLVSEQGTRMAI